MKLHASSWGAPDPKHILTSYVERQNLTYYSFGRIHQTLALAFLMLRGYSRMRRP